MGLYISGTASVFLITTQLMNFSLFITLLIGVTASEVLLWDRFEQSTSIIHNEPVTPPSDIRIVDLHGRTVDSLILDRLEELNPIYLKCRGENVTWSISPSLPDGLSLSQETTALISGAPIVSIPLTVFTVTAKNDGGEASGSFSITVMDCQYGRFLYPKTWKSGRVVFEVFNGSKIIYSKNVTSDYSSICIPQGSYQYTAKCYMDTAGYCYFSLTDETQYSLLNHRIELNKTVKGTFDMNPTVPPHITFKPIVSIPVGKHIHLMIEVEGGCSDLTITPPLEGFEVDGFFALIGKGNETTLTPFTITAVNEKGSTTFESVLAIDMCPDGLELLSFKTFSISQYDVMRVYDSSHNLLFDLKENPEFGINANLCVKEGEYWIDYRQVFGGYEARFQNPLYILQNNHIIATFDFRGEDHQRRFSISVPIHEQSSMKYTTSVSGDWQSIKFKDDKWKDGSSGKWGSFSSSNPSVYFRKEFEVSNPDSYSFLHLGLIASDDATVYLNGEYLTQISAAFNLTRSIFSNEKLLKKGKNVLAVEMKAINPASSSAIVFDLQLKLTTSECLMTSYGGTASEGSHVNGGVDVIFNPFSSEKWTTKGFPTMLHYSYPFRARHSTTHMKMIFDKSTKPTKFHINGLDGDKKVLIFTQKETTPIPLDGFATFLLDVPGVYSGYEIVIEETFPKANITLRDIRFFSCNPLVCKKQWGVDEGSIGSVAFKKCPLFKTGSKQLTCEIVDNEGEWIEDDSACLQKYSMSTYSFIDWSVEMANFTAQNQDYILTSLLNVLTDNLTISSDQIKVYLSRDLSTSAINRMRYDIRFIVECEIGDYIFKNMPALITDLNKLVLAKMSSKEPSLSVNVVSYPVIHNPPNGSGIMNAIFIVLLLICVIEIIRLRCTRVRKDKVKCVKNDAVRDSGKEALLV